MHSTTVRSYCKNIQNCRMHRPQRQVAVYKNHQLRDREALLRVPCAAAEAVVPIVHVSISCPRLCATFGSPQYIPTRQKLTECRVASLTSRTTPTRRCVRAGATHSMSTATASSASAAHATSARHRHHCLQCHHRHHPCRCAHHHHRRCRPTHHHRRYPGYHRSARHRTYCSSLQTTLALRT